MARYRVKEGRTFGPSNNIKAGSIVVMDPEDAKPFLDKLIPLDKAPAAAPLKNDLGMQVPEDLNIEPAGEDEPFEEPGIRLVEDENLAAKKAGKKKKAA